MERVRDVRRSLGALRSHDDVGGQARRHLAREARAGERADRGGVVLGHRLGGHVGHEAERALVDALRRDDDARRLRDVLGDDARHVPQERRRRHEDHDVRAGEDLGGDARCAERLRERDALEKQAIFCALVDVTDDLGLASPDGHLVVDARGMRGKGGSPGASSDDGNLLRHARSIPRPRTYGCASGSGSDVSGVSGAAVGCVAIASTTSFDGDSLAMHQSWWAARVAPT